MELYEKEFAWLTIISVLLVCIAVGCTVSISTIKVKGDRNTVEHKLDQKADGDVDAETDLQKGEGSANDSLQKQRESGQEDIMNRERRHSGLIN